jgi:RHS repeat-associated protein
MKRFLTVLSLAFLNLYAGEDPGFGGAHRLVVHGESETLVYGCVHTGSGAVFIGQADLGMEGVDALPLVRYYNNFHTFNDAFGAHTRSNYSFRTTAIQKKKGSYSLIVEEPAGSRIEYAAQAGQDEAVFKKVDATLLRLNNLGADEISARTDLANDRWLFKSAKEPWHKNLEKGGSAVFTDGSGIERHYIGRKFEYGDTWDWKRVAVKDEQGETLRWIEMEEKHRKYRTYRMSNGKSATYHFNGTQELKNSGNIYLSRLTSSDHPETKFEYEQATASGSIFWLTKIVRPEKRYLEIDYDTSSHAKAIYAPTGKGGKRQKLYSFEYKTKKDRITRTKVTDGCGGIYWHEFDSDGKLTSISEFSQKELERRHSLYWNGSRLLTKSLSDSSGAIQCAWSLTYDNRGNVLREELFGNLSGDYKKSITLDAQHRVKGSGVEVHTREYTYSEDGYNLKLSEKEEGAAEHRYRYRSGTDLLIADFTLVDGKTVRRQFRDYSSTGVLIEIIEDDGAGSSVSDVTDVSERRIRRSEPVVEPQAFGYGLPRQITQLYWDSDTDQEVQLSREVVTYASQDLAIRRDIYDASDEFSHSEHVEYGERGKVTEFTDVLGQVTRYEYDANDNCTLEERVSSGMVVKSYYDRANRLEKSVQHLDDGRELQTSYKYDRMGQIISETNPKGGVTEYTYDHLGREIKTVFPEDSTGQRASVSKGYDWADNVVWTEDANGFTTRYEYNCRGEKTHILYPDGTEERFLYNLNGSLAEKEDRNGLRTKYVYDSFGRLTLIRSLGDEGSVIRNTYRGWQLVQSVDGDGIKTKYKYDGSGRRIEEQRGSERTTYYYDARGNCCESRRWLSDGDFIAEILEYDLLARLVEKRTEKGDGTVQSIEKYEYDRCGNRCSTETFTDVDRSAVVRVEYNGRGEPVSKEDAAGNVTVTTYEGSNCIAVDPLGRMITSQHDSIGRLVKIERTSDSGKVIGLRIIKYDANGNKTRVEESAFALSDSKATPREKSVVIEWEYGPMDRVDRMIEAGEKVTEYEYNTLGQRSTVRKPDGTELHHEYDGFGRLSRLHSSDGTVDLAYVNNRRGLPITITNQLTGETTRRTYDDGGRVVQEWLENGLTLSGQRDALGRRTTLSLPDGSNIQYLFDGVHLKEVTRGKYRHRYTDVDWMGRWIESSGPIGVIQREFTEKGQVCSLSGSHLKEIVPDGGYDEVGRLLSLQIEDPVGQAIALFKYDDLNQLKSEEGLAGHKYSYDSVRNRIKKDDVAHEVNALNQLTGDGNRKFQYDFNGNLSLIGSGERLKYDALDRLVEMTIPGKVSIRLTYDPFHRRMTKQTVEYRAGKWKETRFQRFIYDGDCEIGSVDRQGRLHELRVLGTGMGAEIGAAVLIEIENKSYVPVTSFRGSISALVDADSGEVIESYRHTAFGEEEVFGAPSGPINPWRFSSKRKDEESGWVYFGRRYYAPSIGRWITPDPKGFVDGINLYAYALNDPMCQLDLFGCTAVRPGSKAHLDQLFRGHGQSRAIENQAPFRVSAPYAVASPWRAYVPSLHRWAPQTSVVGYGEVNSHTRVTMTTGIGNSRMNTASTAAMISRAHGNVNVHYTDWPTRGIARDIMRTFGGIFGQNRAIGKELVRNWRARISEMGGVDGGGSVIHLAHSGGCMNTIVALGMLSEEERKMITVHAFGSPSPLSGCQANRAYNYYNAIDPVSVPARYGSGIDPREYNVEYLHGGFSTMFNHGIATEPYRTKIDELGDDFQRKHGAFQL